MYKIGWFSTGRDKAARDLLQEVIRNIEMGFLGNTKIEFVFCNRRKGEAKESDLFLRLASESYAIPTITFSSAEFKPHLRKKDVNKWRINFDRQIMKLLKGFRVDIVIFAGYMLIVGPEMCRRYNMINLHPALPGGPKGAFEEVIRQLIESKEKESGVTIHLVTPELDAGPPITFCSFPIQLPYKTEGLWYLWDLFHEDWVKEKLFNWIRTEGLKREFPLIVETVRLLASGEIKIGEGSRDLTKVINKQIKSRR